MELVEVWQCTVEGLWGCLGSGAPWWDVGAFVGEAEGGCPEPLKESIFSPTDLVNTVERQNAFGCVLSCQLILCALKLSGQSMCSGWVMEPTAGSLTLDGPDPDCWWVMKLKLTSR